MVTIQHERKPLEIGVIPDRLFSVVYADNTRHSFALEQDRGTMDVTSKRLTGKASFVRKLVAYYGAFQQGAFHHVWAMNSVRVLTVTTSEKRIANMMAAQHRVTNGEALGMFLYSTPALLETHGPLGNAWLRADGTTTSILRS